MKLLEEIVFVEHVDFKMKYQVEKHGFADVIMKEEEDKRSEDVNAKTVVGAIQTTQHLVSNKFIYLQFLKYGSSSPIIFSSSITIVISINFVTNNNR